MYTHLFYHQEAVEEACARNSWHSVADWFGPDDEVIVLDLGNTLSRALPLERKPKFLRLEHVRTDKPEERSYTYGLNMMVPRARFEWVFLWRSDYIYHRDYFPSAVAALDDGDVVVPYEAFIGAEWCRARWCSRHLQRLREADEDFLLANAHVCPTYCITDVPHFAMRRDVWIEHGGMNDELWGYGFQFPELMYRLRRSSSVRIVPRFNMTAFHQNHVGSFGLGVYDAQKAAELQQAQHKLLRAFGSQEAIDRLKAESRRPPLRPLRDEAAYRAKFSQSKAILRRLSAGIQRRVAGLAQRIVGQDERT